METNTINLKPKLTKLKLEIDRAHRKLRDTIEWQLWANSSTKENADILQRTIEWQNWNVLIKTYFSMRNMEAGE